MGLNGPRPHCSANMKIKKYQTKRTFFIGVLFVFTIILYILLSKFFQVSTITIISRPGWKLYTNTLARFSIQFPDNISIKEENPVWKVFLTDQGKGWVCFYEKPYEANCRGGFMLWYEIPFIDGKGGGCDLKDASTVRINGKQEKVCITNNSLGNILYLKHPNNLVEIFPVVTFSNFITKDIAIQMLETFRFIDIY